MGERKEKSLASLTKKFIDILKNKRTVDLNAVAKELDCSKKRRIYDVSNVLEGVGLIKRTRKNHYTYFGKQKSESSLEVQQQLEQLRADKKSLEALEKELDDVFIGLKSNFESLFTNKSYLYVTHDDLDNAYAGSNQTILVAKDYKHIKIYFEKESDDSNVINNNIPQVYLKGYLIRPVQLKMVNCQQSEHKVHRHLDGESIALLDEAVTDDDSSGHLTMERAAFNRREIMKTSNQLRLFKTGMKQKKLIEHDRSELQSLAENVLSFNRYHGKSKFQYVSDCNLVLPDDYTNPGLISINPHESDEYADNYSTESPSVHDLYDLDASPVSQDFAMAVKREKVDELMGDGEQEEEEEEYIIEMLDEEMLDMLQ